MISSPRGYILFSILFVCTRILEKHGNWNVLLVCNSRTTLIFCVTYITAIECATGPRITCKSDEDSWCRPQTPSLRNVLMGVGGQISWTCQLADISNAYGLFTLTYKFGLHVESGRAAVPLAVQGRGSCGFLNGGLFLMSLCRRVTVTHSALRL